MCPCACWGKEAAQDCPRVGCSSRQSWKSQTEPRYVLRFSLSKETREATKTPVPVTPELWQLIPAIVGYFFRSTTQAKFRPHWFWCCCVVFRQCFVRAQRTATLFIYFFSNIWNSSLDYTDFIFFPKNATAGRKINAEHSSWSWTCLWNVWSNSK